MNCPHCGRGSWWRETLLASSLGYVVGIGCALPSLGWKLRWFLVVWPLLMLAFSRPRQPGALGRAMDRDEKRRSGS